MMLSARGTWPLEEALAILVLMGGLFPLLAWLLLRRATPLPASVARVGASEWGVLAALVLMVTAWLAVGRGPVDALLAGASPAARQVGELAGKLLVFVAIPWFVMTRIFGRRAADFGLGRSAWVALNGRHGVAALVLGLGLIGFQWFVGAGAAPIRDGAFDGIQLAIGLPLSFLWLVLEVGLVEEFFFRGLLQQRFAAGLGSELAGGVAAAVLFGLAHAPGYVLRSAAAVEALGRTPDVADAIAYSIAIASVAAILFGVIWGLTRNLWVGIIPHAAIDLLPNAPDLMRAFGPWLR
jgi:membrane protease YdiL (CAAX protease family)